MTPSSVSVGALAETLRAIERIVQNTRQEDPEGTALAARESSPTGMRLIRVKRGSARYQVYIENALSSVQRLRLAGEGIDSPESHNWTVAELSAISALSGITRTLDCSIEILDMANARQHGDILARIGPATYEHVSAGAFVHGRSSAACTIIRAGGARPRCSVRLLKQPDRIVYCTVATEELVRELGAHAYEEAEIGGDFTWIRRSWEVDSIHVLDVSIKRRGRTDAALQTLREKAWKRWEAIPDRAAYIRELREK